MQRLIAVLPPVLSLITENLRRRERAMAQCNSAGQAALPAGPAVTRSNHDRHFTPPADGRQRRSRKRRRARLAWLSPALALAPTSDHSSPTGEPAHFRGSAPSMLTASAMHAKANFPVATSDAPGRRSIGTRQRWVWMPSGPTLKHLASVTRVEYRSGDLRDAFHVRSNRRSLPPSSAGVRTGCVPLGSSRPRTATGRARKAFLIQEFIDGPAVRRAR